MAARTGRSFVDGPVDRKFSCDLLRYLAMATQGGTPCARGGCTTRLPQHTGPGQPRRYCSDACKQAAYRARLTTREATRATLMAWAATTADHEGERVG